MRRGIITLCVILVVLAFAGCSSGTYLTPYTPTTDTTSAYQAPITTTASTTSQTPIATTSTASGSEQAYLKAAIPVNVTVTQGIWQVIVVRAGLFTQTVFLSTTTYLRIDLQIANIGTAPDYFQPSHIAVISPQGQYSVDDFAGTLSTLSNDVYPNFQATGYWLFTGPLTSLSTAKLVFTEGYDANFNGLQWSFQL
jgi:hypothetical protein